MTVGLGIRVGLLLNAVTARTWPKSVGPAVMPVRLTVWSPAFSRTAAGLLIGSSVGVWLTCVTVTRKVMTVVSTPPLTVPPLSWTVTVIVAEPLVSGVGVNVRVPVPLGL